MGEIAWVRKYRPSSFDDYMGDNVKNLVMNRFKDRNNIPNTIMLYGRGQDVHQIFSKNQPLCI